VLIAWLKSLTSPVLRPETLRPATELTGAGMFYRIFSTPDGVDGPTYLLLDAGAAHEDSARFVKVADILRKTGVTVPAILAHDAALGLVLLGEVGTTTYLHQLNLDTANKLYLDAIDALVLMQVQGQPDDLPEVDRATLLHELMLFPEWYVGKHLGVALNDIQTATLNRVFDALLANIAVQPLVTVHGDYQSRNLLVQAAGNPLMLGFQDARFGPICYDVVSLLRDAAIQWDEEMVLDWAIRYWERAKRAGLPVSPDIDGFYQDFEFTGVQRHLAQLGSFARRYHRDGLDDLLPDLPLLLEYLRKTAFRYKALAPLVRLLDELEDKQPQVGYTF
jgi:hypothetical protein